MNTAPQQMELALMSREEAEAAVASIHGAARNVRALLRDLERRRGWQSMGFRSFDAFLEAEFDWSPGYAHRQIRAAEVEENLTLPIGSLREAQARELSALPAAVQRMVWERVGGEEGLTAKRIKAVVAEVQPKDATLPGANGDEPAPPGEVSATCSVCHRHFTETLEPGAVASRTCRECRAKPSRHGITQSEPASHDVMADAEGPAPTPEGEGAPDASSTHAEDDQGDRRLEPTPPREGDLAAPPTHGIPASRAMPAPGAASGGEVAHGATDAVSRQATRSCADPDDSPPPSDLAYLRAHGIPEGTALRLARKVVEAAGEGNPFRVVEEDAEILRVVREVSAKVDGGLERLLRVMAQPGFLNWMNRHRGKRDG